MTVRLSNLPDYYGAGLNRTGYVEQMRDSEVVASIVAGEPDGLAVAYDRYAGDLYGYCRSLLREPDDAADAVQDTFVIAASKLGGLREPDRLRAWLFAVARNECLHRLKSHRAASPLHDAPEQADDNADVGGAAERAETIALVRAAADGLNDGERDVINQLWHGLEVPEAAAVLGVSRNHAYALFSRAREQLEASVGVLLVGRAGRRDCAALDGLLGDWDGRLTARLRRRVGRHIDQCGTCSDRRRQELTPAMLYSVTPGALLALAALRTAPVVGAAGQLAGLRDAVLALAGNGGPHAAILPAGTWHAVARRSTHSFGANGFPRQPATGHLAFLSRPHLPLAPISMVGGTAVAATATVVVAVAAPHPGPAPDTHGGHPTISAPLRAGMRAAPSAGTSWTGTSGPGGQSRTLTRVAVGAPGKHGSSGSVLGGAGGEVTVSPSATGAGTGLAGASADPTDESVTQPANDQASDLTSETPTATATVATDDPTVAGTLTVSPTAVLLTPLTGGSLTLTASGGPVDWTISVPANLLGKLSVTPSSGTLAAGGSVTVAISMTGLLSLDTQLTVDPGGQVVTVVLGLS
jgi:RNA polymerase sigma factor (sigma-70 family)